MERSVFVQPQCGQVITSDSLVPGICPPITRPGDCWLIGDHRLICGDSTDPDTYVRLLEGAKAQMIFTDPPYNVPIEGHVSGLGKVKHREFAMASGEMTEVEFTEFLATVFQNQAGHSADGAIHFIYMDWRHLGEIIAAGKSAYSELKNLCVWAKTNGGMGSLYRSQHELVFVFKAGTGPHINNVELGKHGRYHMPGGRWYDRTKINPAKGERWFCSEAEAMAAGWRKTLR